MPTSSADARFDGAAELPTIGVDASRREVNLGPSRAEHRGTSWKLLSRPSSSYRLVIDASAQTGISPSRTFGPAFQSRILEAIANGVITLSPRRIITTFNRAAEASLGVDASAITGRHASAIGGLIPKFPELLEIFFNSGGVQLRAEVGAIGPGDVDLTMELRLVPLEHPEGTGVAVVIIDVTRNRLLEKAAEAQVVKSRDVLESFSRYLAPHVVKTLMNDPSSIKLGGERTRATTFFADVRGFTSMAEQLPAQRVVEIINGYFEEAVRVVFEHDGLLDKFYGDGLMAVFGPPLARDDDAARAVEAAVRLHEEVGKLAPRLDYPLEISVGLATGDVVAGYFGSTKRMDYTVIGKAVNLANGLQAAAPAGTIYCDEETISCAGKIAYPVQKRLARLKGRTELVPIYAITP